MKINELQKIKFDLNYSNDYYDLSYKKIDLSKINIYFSKYKNYKNKDKNLNIN